MVSFAPRGKGDHRNVAAALQRSASAFEPWLPHAQRVRGARSKASAPSGNGPGRCGTWGLRAPVRCATVPSGTNGPAAWKRLIVARTVDAATPIRRAISRVGTPPTNFNRSTSRTWRMVVLSAEIQVPPSKTEGSDLSRPAEAPDPGRDHPGMVLTK